MSFVIKKFGEHMFFMRSWIFFKNPMVYFSQEKPVRNRAGTYIFHDF